MALSPMMQQYLDTKQQYPDAALLFRVGDFYELFFDDAEQVSRELELTLTRKDCGLSKPAPMCGVPYHAVDAYVAKLIEKGYKVAICDQMEDPAQAKGLVERAVTRVITPGTAVESSMLDERRASYIMAILVQKDKAGAAFCDVSTGEFYLYQFDDVKNRLRDELSRVEPRELLVCDQEYFIPYSAQIPMLTPLPEERFHYAQAGKALMEHFHVQKVAELNVEGCRLGVCAAGALLTYLLETQKNALKHILTLKIYQPNRYMALDAIARGALELTESLRGGRGRKGSLLWLMDKTITAMGSRMLRSWIEQPLILPDEIAARQDAVEYFLNDPFRRDTLREALEPVRDVERLLSRIAYDTINARDCLALRASLEALPLLCQTLSGDAPPMVQDLRARLSPLPEVTDLLERAISEKAGISLKDGDIIADGYNAELDELRAARTEGAKWLSDLEAREREQTGIKNLKVGFNRVFGYYIEVTKSFYDQVPTMRYVRKQTLASAERFITEELKELEKKILGAEDHATRLEYQLFLGVREFLSAHIVELARVAHALKELDALLSLAQCAADYSYVRPSFNQEGVYEIQNGRHPVVEQAIGSDNFVPNDTHMSREGRMMVITGPNMAGKSTYMRQVALIVLLAHIGSFVPADSANISITDRIFTRIGASDDLYGGQSTFMVEMSELANILKYATSKSLLILDEVGRGTSTFDGLSIAWAAVEHIADEKKCGARTLFATHYHELSELEGHLEGVVNYRITAVEKGSEVIFLRKIVPGGADRSYGVAVAGLAGLPKSLIMRARQIMARLEVDDETSAIGQSILDNRKNGGDRQMSLTDFQPMELVEEIRKIDVMSMSPIDALNTLFTLVEKARRI